MKRRVLAALLAAAAACAALTGCGGKEQPYPLSAQRIREDTEYLCNVIGDRPTGTEKEAQACDWLEGALEEIGFSYEAGNLERTYFEGFPDMYSENLVATCNPGSEGPILCVMAHYDSVEGTRGARDNGSSVAALLEIARYLGPAREDLEAEVRLLFLGSEENGYHGASAYIESLTEEELRRHLAAYNLENSAAVPGEGAVLMCATMGAVVDGEYREGNFLEPLDNLASRTVEDSYQALYDGGEIPVFHMGGSDHRIFHQAGIEASNVCWKYLREDGFPRVPPEYHQPTDTPDGMDFDGAVLIGRCILDALYRLADGGGAGQR